MSARSLSGRAEFDAFARAFAVTLERGDVVALCGELGAGKTAFVRAAAEALGVRDDVSSPTFVFRQRYDGPIPVDHLDLYRVESRDELAELGLEDAFDGEGIAFVEWPERAPELIPSYAVTVEIAGSGDEPRTVTIRRGRFEPVRAPAAEKSGP